MIHQYYHRQPSWCIINNVCSQNGSNNGCHGCQLPAALLASLCVAKWTGFSVPFGSSICSNLHPTTSDKQIIRMKQPLVLRRQGLLVLLEESKFQSNKQKAHLTIGQTWTHHGKQDSFAKISLSSIQHILETVWHDNIKWWLVWWSTQERLHQSSNFVKAGSCLVKSVSY